MTKDRMDNTEDVPKCIVKGNLKYCPFCNRTLKRAFAKHIVACDRNPKNIKSCLNCGTILSKVSKSHRPFSTKRFCNPACSLKYNNRDKIGQLSPAWRGGTQPRQKSWSLIHSNKCMICKFDKVVHKHHLDGNRLNNHPLNMIPLCPNHHFSLHLPDPDKECLSKIKKYINRLKKSQKYKKAQHLFEKKENDNVSSDSNTKRSKKGNGRTK